MSVFAYIGTPPLLRRQSRLLWRQGPCYLIEDVVAMPVIQMLYRIGPNYVGSLQAPGTQRKCILFALHIAFATSFKVHRCVLVMHCYWHAAYVLYDD